MTNRISYEKETTINESGNRRHVKIRECQSYSKYDDFVINANWEDGELIKVEIKGWYNFQPEVKLSSEQLKRLLEAIDNGLLNLRSMKEN